MSFVAQKVARVRDGRDGLGVRCCADARPQKVFSSNTKQYEPEDPHYHFETDAKGRQRRKIVSTPGELIAGCRKQYPTGRS